MKLFDIYGVLKIKGLQEAKKGLNEVGEEAKNTGSWLDRMLQRLKDTGARIFRSIGNSVKSTFNKMTSDANIFSNKLMSVFNGIKLKIPLGSFKSSLNSAESTAKSFSNRLKSIFNVLKLPKVSTSTFTASLNSASSTAKSFGTRLQAILKGVKLPKVNTSPLKSSLTSAEHMAKHTANNINNSLGSVKNSFGGLKGILGGVGGLLAGVGVSLGTKAVFDYSKNLDQARINWEVLMGSAEKGQEMLSRIQKFAKDTPFDFDSTQKFAQQLKIAGLNGDQLFKTMQVIGDAAQGNVEKAEGIATAYQQMSAKGKIQTEEMNQLLERGIPAWDMLAKATGKTKAELMDMASKGKLLSDEYLPKLVEQMDATFGGGMQKQAQTFNGQLDQLEDNLLMLGSRGVAPLRQALTGLMKDMNDVFDGKMSVTEMLGKWGQQFKEGLTKLGEMIANFDLASFVKKLLKGFEVGGGFISDVIQGFAKLVDGIFEFLRKTDWESIAKEIRSKIVDSFKNFDLGGAVAWIVNKIVELGHIIIDNIKNTDYGDVGATLGKLLREAISKVGDFLADVDWGNVLSLLWDGFVAGLELVFVDLPSYIVNFLSGLFLGMSTDEIGESIGTIFDNIGNWLSEKWDALTQWLSETVSGWWDSLSGAFDSFSQSLVTWLGEKIVDIIQFFIELPTKVSETVSGWWEKMSSSFSTWWQNLKQWISEKFNELVQWFKDLPSKIAEFGSWIWNGITSSLSSMWSTVTNWFTEKFNQLVSWFRDLPNKISSFGTWIWGGITGSLSSMWGIVTGWFNEKFNQLVSWFREAPSRVAGFGTWIWSSISGGLSSLWSSVTSIGSSIVEGVWNGIVSATGWFYSQVESFFSNLVESAKSFLGINSPSKVFAKTVGHAIPEGVGLGVKQKSDSALESIATLSKDMVDAWQGDFDTNFNAYGNVSFDSETSNPFKLLNSKFDELTTAFSEIEFKGVMNIDGEHIGEALYTPLNNLIDEGGII
nr:MAG TPA: tail tape measure protein [Caudoviricetes sp.]